jgi:FkbM family methyltransferase
MIQEIHEHSIDLDLLPKNANILDLGCRGFEFTNFFRQLGHNVYPVDVDDLGKDDYYRLAISDKDGMCAVEHTQDPRAKFIKEGNEIKKMSIKSFSEWVGVDTWDLIKIDIEGEEYNILKNIEHPIANQVSVEFHEHCNCKVGKEKLDELLDELSNYYNVHNANWEERHCVGNNYWDVLLIKKQ